jgi:hypothetical protein
MAALMVGVAGCTSDARPETQTTRPSAEPVFASGCPELSAPPFGVDAKAEQVSPHTIAAEQDVLDHIVPGARIDRVVCQYMDSTGTYPGIEVDVRMFRGAKGPAQARTLAYQEQSTNAQLTDDFVIVSESGEGGFAWYDEPQFLLATHAGGAYIIVVATPGAAVVKDPDNPPPVRKQVPVLTAVMTQTLAALR